MSFIKKTPLQAKHVNIEEMGDEYLLYDTVEAQAIYLNASSALIWTLCDGKRTVADIVQLLEEEYYDSKNISTDVTVALNELMEKRVISFK